MGSIFNYDNKVFQAINKIVDCVFISVLWLLSCIPIITVGAAITSFYYVIHKVIRYERGNVWTEYWKSFKTNFKQSTTVWIILLALYCVLAIDGYIMYQFALLGQNVGVLFYVFILVMGIVTMWAQYLFPYIARFQEKTKVILKNSIFIAIANFGRSILLFAFVLAEIIIITYVPIGILIFPALFMILTNSIMEKIFAKYMTPESLAEENIRNSI